MSDETNEERNENEPTGIELMTRALGEAIEGVQRDSETRHAQAVIDFAKSVSDTRSRRAPVPKRDEDDGEPDTSATLRGDAMNARTLRVLGDARDSLYRRMAGNQVNDVESHAIYRAARNPGIDDISKRWLQAVVNRDGGARAALHRELDDEFLKGAGVSRASLLEGVTTGENPLADGSGSSLLPLPLANQLIYARDAASKMRQLVNVFPMTSQTVRVPVLPVVAATSRLENAAFSDVTPSSDHVLLNAKDVGCMVSYGRNFGEDTSFNIVNQLTVVAGSAIGYEEDVQICTSTANGGDITEGLDAATITDIAEVTVSSIFYDDIVNLYYGVPQQYRPNAKFFCAGTTMKDIMNIIDGNGRPMFINAVEAPRPISDSDSAASGVLFGKPVYEVPVADDVIYFGDPMWYALGDRTGIRVDSDRDVTTGNTQIVIDERVDGRVIPTSVVGSNLAWRKVIY